MKRIFIILIAIGLIGGAAKAQKAEDDDPLTIVEGSHITIGVRGAYSNLMINNSLAKDCPGGAGFGFNAAYTHFVSDHIGLRIGLDFTSLSSKYTIPGTVYKTVEEVRVSTNPATGETRTVDATYTTTVGAIESKYQLMSFDIPLQIALQGEKWFANVGVKFCLPYQMKEKTHIGASDIICNTVGLNTFDISEAVSKGGDVDYLPYDSKQEVNNFRPFFIASAIEVGYRIGFRTGHSIQIGAYVEMAFNECAVTGDAMVATHNGDKIDYHPTFGSDLIESMRAVDAGLKLQYDISCRRPRKK